EVAYSSNGDDALDKVEAVRPDGILLLLLMPGMSGRERLAAPHGEPGITQLPSPVTTGIPGLPPHRAIALSGGAVPEQPFDIDATLNKIGVAMFRVQSRDHEASVSEHGDEDRGAGEDGSGSVAEGGVVLIVERDLGARRYLDGMLVANGFRVVS